MKKAKIFVVLFAAWLAAASGIPRSNKEVPSALLPEQTLQAIENEVSGSICFEHVAFLSTLHRIWGSRDYHAAAQYAADRARAYGLSEIKIEQYPIRTGRENFWLQSSGGYVPWDCREGELRLIQPFPMLITSYESAASSVAVHSRSTDVTAELVFVGRGDSEEDYKRIEIEGKIALAQGGRHEQVHELAVHKHGALGTIQFFLQQGNFREAEGIYWGRLWPWGKEDRRPSTFGFNISTSQGIFLKSLLEKGKVVVTAKAQADVVDNGVYELATAVIPGSTHPEEEFIFYSHLDHPRPGAHDNASGDAVLLEIGRTLSSLIQNKIIPPPARTIRFMWIPHMSGLNMYFVNHPEKIGKIRAGCNVDCVGVNQAKFPSTFHVALPPHSLSTFLADIANNLADHLNRKITKAISEGSTEDFLFSPEGSRNLFSVTMMPYQGASDEYTANTRSLHIPSIYFYDDPLPPRHNQINFLEYIDPTNLKRISYLGAAISYAFAAAGEATAPSLLNEIDYRGKIRLGGELLKAKNLIENSNLKTIHQSVIRGRNLLVWGIKREKEIDRSLAEILAKEKSLSLIHSEHERLREKSFHLLLEELKGYYELSCRVLKVAPLKESPGARTSPWENAVPVLNPKIKGSPGYFSNYFEDRLGEDFLKKYPGVRASFRYGHVGYYETLNYIDGQNTVADIYEALQAELWSEDYSPGHDLSFEEMSDYLRLLADAQVIELKKGK